MSTTAEGKGGSAEGWSRRHLFVLLHAAVAAGCTALFAGAWTARDQVGEVDVTAVLAGVPIWLLALPWSMGFFVTGGGENSVPLQFPAVIALGWVNVGLHCGVYFWYRRRRQGGRGSHP